MRPGWVGELIRNSCREPAGLAVVQQQKQSSTCEVGTEVRSESTARAMGAAGDRTPSEEHTDAAARSTPVHSKNAKATARVIQ